MAMMAARGIHLNGSMPSYPSASATSNTMHAMLAAKKPASTSAGMKSMLSTLGRAPPMTSKHQLTSISGLGPLHAPATRCASVLSTSTLPTSAKSSTQPTARRSDDADKENVDPLGHTRAWYREQQRAMPQRAQPSHPNMMQMSTLKRKFEAEPLPSFSSRVPLADITAQVLERDYKIKMTDRHTVVRVPTASSSGAMPVTSMPFLPLSSLPFTSNHTAPAKPTTSTLAKPKTERVIRAAVSPRKRALQQQRTIPSMPVASVPFAFNYDMSRIVAKSMPSTTTTPAAATAATKEISKKPSIAPPASLSTTAQTTMRPTVYKTSVKKDNLFDIHVQLGLKKPSAEQMKLKAPSTPFAAPKMTADPFMMLSKKTSAPAVSSARFALGRLF